MKLNPAIALLMVLGLAACQDAEQNTTPQTTSPLAAAPQGLEPQEATPQEIAPPEVAPLTQTEPPSAPPQ